MKTSYLLSLAFLLTSASGFNAIAQDASIPTPVENDCTSEQIQNGTSGDAGVSPIRSECEAERPSNDFTITSDASIPTPVEETCTQVRERNQITGDAGINPVGADCVEEGIVEDFIIEAEEEDKFACMKAQNEDVQRLSLRVLMLNEKLQRAKDIDHQVAMSKLTRALAEAKAALKNATKKVLNFSLENCN